MRKVTSTDISNAIDFALSRPEVSEALSRRDDDSVLDCLHITCSVISAPNARDKEFEIIVNYEDVRNREREKEDIGVKVLYREGEQPDWKWKTF